IKPSNFLLSRQGDRIILKMTDLGLARTVNEAEFRVTRDGTTVGTVDYMAPEQARDSTAADVRSDIYSLGCTFYQMLSGQPPCAGTSPAFPAWRRRSPRCRPPPPLPRRRPRARWRPPPHRSRPRGRLDAGAAPPSPRSTSLPTRPRPNWGCRPSKSRPRRDS